MHIFSHPFFPAKIQRIGVLIESEKMFIGPTELQSLNCFGFVSSHTFKNQGIVKTHSKFQSIMMTIVINNHF